jgi:hypothetical protein
MLQSWGTSTLSHDTSLYSGRSAPVISPAQKRQAVSNDCVCLVSPALAYPLIKVAIMDAMTQHVTDIFLKFSIE